MPNRNLGRVALVATLLLAATASADEEEGEVEVLVYARPGFYVGVGGSYGSPVGWDSDFDNDPLEEEASDLANQNAMDDLESRNPPPNSVIVPVAVSALPAAQAASVNCDRPSTAPAAEKPRTKCRRE